MGKHVHMCRRCGTESSIECDDSGGEPYDIWVQPCECVTNPGRFKRFATREEAEACLKQAKESP